jgi:cytochrome c
MLKFPNVLVAAAASVLFAGAAMADTYDLGRAATPDEVAAWDIDIRPDGAGLPEGSGSVMDGEGIYTQQCAMCHGDFGEGIGRWPVLAGGKGTLTRARPVKTVGSYWPYLSTVWDYVNRAMPFGNAQSLSGDEVYALTAYIMYLNDLVDDEFVLDRQSFAEVKMPNEDGFYPDDRMETAVWKKTEACMSDCKENVEITARAAVVDVTPDDPTSKHRTGETSTSEEPKEAEKEAAAPETTQVAAAVDPALAKEGEKVFRKCSACHAVGEGAKHKMGPHLNGVFGRQAGTADGFGKYSKDMIKAGEDGLVWDDASMASFLEKPKGLIKRTKMAFGGLRKQEDVDAIIAYLRSASD